MARSDDCVFEHLIGGGERIDVPRSCAFVIQAITLVCEVTPCVRWRRTPLLARLLAHQPARFCGTFRIFLAVLSILFPRSTVQLPFTQRSPKAHVGIAAKPSGDSPSAAQDSATRDAPGHSSFSTSFVIQTHGWNPLLRAGPTN